MSFLPAMAAVASIAGTAMSVAGQIQQGQAAAQAGKAQKAAAEYNAAVWAQHAELIGRQTELDIYRQQRAAQRLKSQQRVAYAKAGVLLEGSPTSVLIDSAAEAEMDMMITQYNADIAKKRALSGAEYQRYLGSVYEEQGKVAKKIAYFGAGTTLLTGVSEFATKIIPTKKKAVE